MQHAHGAPAVPRSLVYKKQGNAARSARVGAERGVWGCQGGGRPPSADGVAGSWSGGGFGAQGRAAVHYRRRARAPFRNSTASVPSAASYHCRGGATRTRHWARRRPRADLRGRHYRRSLPDGAGGLAGYILRHAWPDCARRLPARRRSIDPGGRGRIAAVAPRNEIVWIVAPRCLAARRLGSRQSSPPGCVIRLTSSARSGVSSRVTAKVRSGDARLTGCG